MTKSLEKILDGAPADTPAPGEGEQSQPAKAGEAPEPQKVEPTSAAEPTKVEPAAAAPPAAPQAPQPQTVPLSALEDERRKRQEREREVETLNQRLQALERQPKTAAEQKSFYDDPEGFLRQHEMNMRGNVSRTLLMSTTQDYEAMEAYFEQRTRDPNLQYLLGQLVNHPNPAKYVYDTAKRLKAEEEFDAAGGLDKWKEREREAIRTELMKGLTPAPVPTPSAPPASLAAAPSPATPPDTFAPSPIDSLVGPRKKRA